MRNRILKITTAIVTLCIGIMLSPVRVSATESGEVITISPGSVYNNTNSGLKEYCPNAGEFTYEVKDGVLTISDVDVKCTEPYDAVMLPGSYTVDSTKYDPNYSIEVFKKLSSLGKGVVVQPGAIVPILEDGLDITYVRFDDGAKLEEYGHAFRDWANLTKVEGLAQAIEPKDGVIELGDTFRGCKELTEVILDFDGEKVNIGNTFTGCDKLTKVTIKDANVTKVYQMAVRSSDAYSKTNGIISTPMTITFDNITFPENDGAAYLDSAFQTVSGTVMFKNCKAGTSNLITFDKAFYNSKAINVLKTLDVATYVNDCEKGSYLGGNIEVKGAYAYSAKQMFSESSYGVIKLDNLIKEETVNATSMFSDSSLINIKGIDTWLIGEVDLSEMFKGTVVLYDVESETEHPNNLISSIEPALEEVDFSKAKKADEMMCFGNKDYIADYSHLDFSGLGTFIPVSKNVPFVTPAEAPARYKLPYDSVYYQTEDDKKQCGGYKLTMVTGTSGTIDGEALATNTLMVGDRAEIRVINAVSGDASTYLVIGGYTVQDYLGMDTDYFTDNQCTTPVPMTNVVANGDNLTVYTKDDSIKKDVDDGVKFDFGTTTGNLSVTVDGSTDQLRMIEYNPKLTIKKEQTPDSYVIENNDMKANGQFYDIGITVNVDGVDKQVKTISRALTVTVPLPDNYDGKGVVVLHYDKGLNQKPTRLSSNVNEAAKTVTFYMSSFSHVAVLYNEAEKETKEIKVVWEDDGNWRNRSGIIFNWVATYESGVTDSGTVRYTADAQDETVLSFDVFKKVLDSDLKSVEVTYSISKDIEHTDEWDNENLTLTLTLDDESQTEDRVVKVDFTDVEESDFNQFVASAKTITLNIQVTYEDGTVEQKNVTRSLANNYLTYQMPWTLTTVTSDGVRCTQISYEINIPESYHIEVDYETDEITVTKEKDVYGDWKDFTVTGVFEDDSNKDGKRPERVKAKVIAVFGEKEWSTMVTINCWDLKYSGYNTHTDIPATCNGEPRTDLRIEPEPVLGYTVTIGNLDTEGARLMYKVDTSSENPGTTSYKHKVTVSFVNDQKTTRPQQVTLYLQDANGGNQISRVVTIDTNNNTTEVEVDVPTDGVYSVYKVDGIAQTYTVQLNGANVTAIYNNQSTTPPTAYHQDFSITINDNDNEDGSRPDKATVTVSDGKGNTQTFEVDIASGKTFTKRIDVPDESSWSITKIEGLPERMKVSLSANSATINYTPEKMTKTVSVKWEGDGDNKDETRPTSVVVHVNNGSTLVTNATLDKNTNWSANVELNKYRAGVEAKYTLDCDDVKNYSKTVGEDTITFKFTGTLTEEAQKAEDAKKNGTAATGTNGTGSAVDGVKELDFSIDSFDWIDYANRYPDLKRAYGYNKQKLYAHYIRYGIAEGRYATFTGKYSSVNEDILAAYFPDDYKYALISTSTDGTKTETTTTETTTNEFVDTVSGNSVELAEPTDGDGTIVNDDGTITEKITGEDGTVTEITKDADGNIISTKQYKTGDSRDIAARTYIMLGILFLLSGGYIGFITLRKKAS